MPYSSLKQQAFFHANKKKLEAQGVDVAEWDKASKGKKLPDKVKKEAMLKDLFTEYRKLAELDTPCKEPGDTALASGKIPEEGREITEKAGKKPKGEDKMKPPGATKPPEGMKTEGLKTAAVLKKAMEPSQQPYPGRFGSAAAPMMSNLMTSAPSATSAVMPAVNKMVGSAASAIGNTVNKGLNWLNPINKATTPIPKAAAPAPPVPTPLHKSAKEMLAGVLLLNITKTSAEMTPEQQDYVMFGKKPTTSVQPTTAPPAPAAPVATPAPKAVAPPIKPASGMNSSANDYVLFGGKKVAAAKALGELLKANKAK